jgi:hypothetical protein
LNVYPRENFLQRLARLWRESTRFRWLMLTASLGGVTSAVAQTYAERRGEGWAAATGACAALTLVALLRAR